jgi:gliding motility-associated-like protein
MENCTILGPDLTFEVCEGESITIGDSTWSSLGQYEMHMLSSNGCDSIFQVFLNGDDSLSINAFVWVDVDQNGIHSPADTLLANSSVILEDATFNLIDNFYSGAGGQYPAGNYFIRIDTSSLSGFLPLYWMDTVSDTVCGEIIFDFLVTPACQLIYMLQSEILCAGDSIFFQNQWIADAGVYSFVLPDPVTGCDTLLELNVSLHPEVQLTYSTDWHCIEGGTIIVETTGTGPFYYSWDPDDWDTDSIYGLAPGIYAVTVTDANQCMDSETITISPDPLLEFNLTPYHEIIPGDSVELILSGDVLIPGLNFQWMPSGLVQCESCATTWAYPFQDTTFTVIITDEDGCVYTLMTFVHIQEDTTQAGQIYVPNVFTPNHDGINDMFVFGSNDSGAEIEELVIFDRWGNMVYFTKEVMLNEFYGWDGTFREKPLHPQVFAYHVKFRMSDGRSLSQYGNVTLVR